jgi:4-amino-4-deoxy-L-arabinose transferase-like glycosyltransferase
MAVPKTSNRPALAIAGLALVLRLVWVLVIVPTPNLYGGDGPYYLGAGRALAGRGDLSWGAMLAIGPVYPLFLSVFFRLLTDEGSVIRAVRVSQAFIDAATCLAVYGLGRRLFNKRAGLAAAVWLAVDLRFIVQAGEIATETLFIFILTASSWLFVLAREARNDSPLIRTVGATGLGLLAAFTRAVALPVPALLTGALLWPQPSRRRVLAALGILGLLTAGVLTWTVVQYQNTGRWVLISDGFSGNFWMGSRSDGQWHGHNEFQSEIDDLRIRYHGQLAYMEDAWLTIQADPAAYARLLVRKAAGGFLQPHGTVAFPGESLKDLAVQVMRRQISPGELINGPAFWPKLYIYVLHYGSLFGGLIAFWLTRRDWLRLLPVTLPIAYLAAAYTLLTIIPRYVFPTMPFLILLAAYSLSRLAVNRPSQSAL